MELNPQLWWLMAAYPLLGVTAGVMAGLLGVGGGLIIVPVLIWLFAAQGMAPELIVHTAVGTSLATIVPTSLSSIRAHHARGAIDWGWVQLLAPGLLLGAFAGAWLADTLNAQWLQRVFALFAITVAVQMLRGGQPKGQSVMPGRGGVALVGGLIGLVSGVVGIGGGSMTVPYLSWRGVDIRRAVASSAACGLPIAIAGAVGFVLTGPAADNPFSAGYLNWPAALLVAAFSVMSAPYGAGLAHTLPIGTLKRIFAVLLTIVGIKLLLG